MTVLPYVMVSLIEGIGSLDGARARRLFVRVGTLSLVLWALALGAVMLMPFVFPEIESASFFSTTLVEARPPLDFVALYIPSNPFHSLANNIVPAVVLFSVFLGVALIGIERKQGLLENLMLIERGLKRANQFAVGVDAHRALRYRGAYSGHGRCGPVCPSAGLPDQLRGDGAASFALGTCRGWLPASPRSQLARSLRRQGMV